MFILEVMNKCITEQDKNQPMFDYLFSTVIALNEQKENNSFHLQFLLELTKYLGFGIYDPGTFVQLSSNVQFYDDPDTRKILKRLLEADFSNAPQMTPEQRTIILNDIVHYYYTQLEMPKLKSLEILRTIFK